MRTGTGIGFPPVAACAGGSVRRRGIRRQGSTADDLNFGDNVATLHSPPGLTNIFEDGADQVALYRSQNMLYLPLILSTGGGSPQPGTRTPSSAVVSFMAWAQSGADDDGVGVLRGLG